MDHAHYTDQQFRDVLTQTKTIALVGASANPQRPSHGVMNFLLQHGYQVVPVNPGLAGQVLMGQMVVGKVTDIHRPIDMIDVFRNSHSVPALVDEILGMPVLPKFIWTQLGVVHMDAANLAESRGIQVIMNRCPAIEIPRLGL